MPYRLSLRWAFCRSAGPEGEGGGFDSPSLPPLDTLPSPKRPGDVPLDPKAEGRSGRLAEKALYCASEVLRIAFSGRHPPCAPILYARPSGAPAPKPANQKRMNIQKIRINNPNIHFTLPPQVTKRKQKPKNSKSGLDTGGGVCYNAFERKGPSFQPVLGLYLLYTIRRKKSL